MFPAIVSGGSAYGYPPARVVIEQVSNGFKVILPPPIVDERDYESHEEALMKKSMDMFHESAQKDPELARLRGENKTQVPKVNYVPLKDVKNENEAVFHTFPEVLEFLSEKYK